MGKTFKRVYDYPKPAHDRRQLLEELTLVAERIEWEESMESVFLIVQEYQPNDTEYDLIDHLGEYYTTRDEAWAALSRLASSWDVELDQDDWSFEIPAPVAGLNYDMYYIEELTRG